MGTSTRDVILKTLKAQPHCTVNDLAEAAGVSPVSVRHHLANLQAEDLVSVKEVRQGVGRPHHEFSLTEKAVELFPSRYFRLTNRLLDEIKDSMPAGLVGELFSSVARTMGEDYATQLQTLPLEERLQRLVDLLSEEGFEARLEKRGDEIVIHELSCPYFRVGQQHPEVCLVDQSFIASALSLPVERVNCLLEGDHHCTYSIQVETSSEETASHD